MTKPVAIAYTGIFAGLLVVAFVAGWGVGNRFGIAHERRFNAAWMMNEGAAFADLTVRGGVFNESTPTEDGWRISVFIDGETFTATAPTRADAMIAVNAKSRNL